MSENPLQTQTEPLVSIVIPFYNREEFLAEAVGSVLAQTVEDWELILVDDGSTDESAAVARGFVEKYPAQIRLVSHPGNRNRGAGPSRNLGIAEAAGRYITFLDSDDVFFPDALERELKAFDENPAADAVCGTLLVWYSWSDAAEKREKDFTVDLVLENERLYEPPELLVHNLYAGGRKPGIGCVMLRRGFAERFELFEKDYRYAWEDQIFWAKVSLHGKVYVTDAVLAKYRQHPASTCAVESEGGEDIPTVGIFLEWLKNYLEANGVEDGEVRQAFRSFRRMIYWETKFKKLKQIYRRAFPLHIRYKIRDRLTRTRRLLLRSPHRHK